jgi:DNA-binding MarR family transcriptional regulator
MGNIRQAEISVKLKGTKKMPDAELAGIVLDWAAVMVRAFLHDFHHRARSSGLSLAQINALVHLYYRGPSEVMDFTELMELSPAGASQMIERMVQQGVVRRAESPDDRRVRLVHLTEQGQQIVEASINSQRARIEEMVGTLPEEQKRVFGQALVSLTQRAMEREGPARRLAAN